MPLLTTGSHHDDETFCERLDSHRIVAHRGRHRIPQTFWTAGTENWFNAGNWTLGVPNANSATTFDGVIANGGTAQLLAPGGSVRRLRVGRAEGPGACS